MVSERWLWLAAALVIGGLATDIVPNASLLTSVVIGCRMETSSANPGTIEG